MFPFKSTKKSWLILLLVLVSSLPSCTPSFSPKSLADQHGFTEHIFHAETFDVMGYLRGDDGLLRVYIEGDGKAWLSQSRPSSDPTPDNPVSFQLAVADDYPAVLYIARPCQFIEGEQRRNCITPFWTSARFSEPVIHDLDQVLDQAKSIASAQRLELVGYSGGGAVALLLAVRRNDVDMVVTIAGNLDHDFWTNIHKVSPLRDSLNPADYAMELQSVEQVHIVSTDDSIVPPSVARSYVSKMSDTLKVQIITVDGVGHTDEWDEVVPGILKTIERNN